MQYTFAIVWPSSHMFGRDDLRLCFEDEAEGLAWRKALQDVIRKLIVNRVGHSIETAVSLDEPLPNTGSSANLRTTSSDGYEVPSPLPPSGPL